MLDFNKFGLKEFDGIPCEFWGMDLLKDEFLDPISGVLIKELLKGDCCVLLSTVCLF